MGIDPVVKLTPEAAQALTNLRASRDFGDFLKWIEEQRQKESEKCEEGEGTHLHRSQGAARTLRDIQKAYDEAPHVLEKLKPKRRGEQ